MANGVHNMYAGRYLHIVIIVATNSATGNKDKVYGPNHPTPSGKPLSPVRKMTC